MMQKEDACPECGGQKTQDPASGKEIVCQECEGVRQVQEMLDEYYTEIKSNMEYFDAQKEVWKAGDLWVCVKPVKTGYQIISESGELLAKLYDTMLLDMLRGYRGR